MGDCPKRQGRGRLDLDRRRLLTWWALFPSPRALKLACVWVFSSSSGGVATGRRAQTPHNPAGLLDHLQRQYNPTTPNQTNLSPCAFAGMYLQSPWALCAFTVPQSHWSPCASTGTHLQSSGAPCAPTRMHPPSKPQQKSLFNLVHLPTCVPPHSTPSYPLPDNLPTHPCVTLQVEAIQHPGNMTNPVLHTVYTLRPVSLGYGKLCQYDTACTISSPPRCLSAPWSPLKGTYQGNCS